MGLSQNDKTTIRKARKGGSAELAVDLDDGQCCYLAKVIARDLGLAEAVGGIPADLPEFYNGQAEAQRIEGLKFWPLMEQLAREAEDVVTFFACLAKLQRARVKYAKILRVQPIPTLEQVGPRGLLQFGTMSPRALTGLLLWRKWIYDIDNRAAQETGYVFEPIIAHSIGGVPYSAAKSPIKRKGEGKKGRQVDCLRDDDAYEIKLRVTIAASGQGRWREEFEFPEDCEASGYTPVLVVFDGTENEKLTQLRAKFEAHGGRVFVGVDAWAHLDEQAGPTMAVFLEKYVRVPLDALLKEVPDPDALPELRLRMSAGRITISVGGEGSPIDREDDADWGDDETLPEDVDDTMAGP